MTGTTSLRSRRRIRAAAPAVGLLAAGLLAWQGSTAAFTATTVSAGNAWTSGTVNLTSNTGAGGAFVASGTARFSVSDIKPGSTGAACITVRSTGSIPGSGRFYVQNVTGTLAPALAPRISLAVEVGALPNGSGPGTTVPSSCAGVPAMTVVQPSTPLTSVPVSYAAAPSSWTLLGGPSVVENRVYRITWAFTSSGTDAGDNLLQGRSATADFIWEVR